MFMGEYTYKTAYNISVSIFTNECKKSVLAASKDMADR